MKHTILLKGDRPQDLKKAGELLRAGGLVAIPTETVYGLAANALDGAAVKAIYQAKGRPSDNPLIVHICDFGQLPPLVREVPEAAKQLAQAFWPGPLTIILKKSDLVPTETSGGLDTVTAVGAEIELEGSLSYGREILSALAGPLANFVLANVFCRLPGGAIFSGLNLVLACFNLLPIGRLDGGRILNCALSWGVGPEIAWNVGHRLDCTLSGLLLVAGIILVQAGNSFTLFLTSIWIYSTFTGRRKTMLRQKQTKRRNSLYQN